jgi:DNA-binding beta-propeller fold protein YncE
MTRINAAVRTGLGVALAAAAASCASAQAVPARPAPKVIAYVSGFLSGTVTPILAGNVAGTPIRIGRRAGQIVAAPDGRTVYVAGPGFVVPIRTATGRAGRPIHVGLTSDLTVGLASGSQGMAITPDGATLLVASRGLGTVTPIHTATWRAGRPIRVGKRPGWIAVTPDGKTAFVSNLGSGTVTPVNIAAGTAGPPIRVGPQPTHILITPDGATAYVLTFRPAVVPIDVATGTAGRPIPVGDQPWTMAMTPDGRWLYVVNQFAIRCFSILTPIRTATNRALRPICSGNAPADIVAAPDNSVFYVVDYGAGVVLAVSTVTRSVGQPHIRVGRGPAFAAVTPDGRFLYVTLDGFSLAHVGNTVVPVNTLTGRAGRPIRVGRLPLDIAIVPARAG